MALIRCKQHSPPQARVHIYRLGVAPAGDGIAVRCGLKQCENQGIVWLNTDEAVLWQNGTRDFPLFHGHDVKVRVCDRLEMTNKPSSD